VKKKREREMTNRGRAGGGGAARSSFRPAVSDDTSSCSRLISTVTAAGSSTRTGAGGLYCKQSLRIGLEITKSQATLDCLYLRRRRRRRGGRLQPLLLLRNAQLQLGQQELRGLLNLAAQLGSL